MEAKQDTDTDSLIIHIKTDDFYKNINNDVDKWFDTQKQTIRNWTIRNRQLEIGPLEIDHQKLEKTKK